LPLNFGLFVENPLNIVTQCCRSFIISIANGFIFFKLQFFDAGLVLRQVRRRRHIFQTHAGSRFVDYINGFIRQAAARDITAGQLHRLEQGFIGKFDTVMLFIAVTQPLENLHRFIFAGRFHNNGLEPAFQCGILFDILAILVKSSRTDALHLTAGQSGLEHIGGINGTLRPAGTNQRMQFVDKQNHIRCTTDFINHRLDAFFKLTAILGPSHHHRQVQHHDSLVFKYFRNLMLIDFLSQAFDNRGLANPSFTQQHRIVFGSTAQNLNQTFNLVGPTNNRIQFTLGSKLG